MLRQPALGLLICIALASAARADAVPVTIIPGGGITRAGKPYFIKGAGGDKHLAEVARCGGNSIRTWTTRDLGPLLDEAQSHGLTVCAGIWLERECSWFSYSNPDHCARQKARVQQEVRAYCRHPALLLWDIGNESEGDGSAAAYWKQLEQLVRATKEIDPAHPVGTSVAGLQPPKIAGLNAHTPSLDFVGINTYAALRGLRKYLAKEKWTRPWVVTEYGPRGFWESPRAPWGAPVEQTSTEKAVMIRSLYEAAILPGGDCWGAYVFLWGQKQEATSTWFGVFTVAGESTATRDTLHELWLGRPPSERAPELKELLSDVAKKVIPPGREFAVSATATDPDGDPLTYHWTITPEEAGRDKNGKERVPAPLPQCVLRSDGASATFRAPAKPGAYRVHLRVTDTRQRAATANFPFRVE